MPFDLTWGEIAIGAAIFAASLLGTSLLAVVFLVRIRADYFVAEYHGISRHLHGPGHRVGPTVVSKVGIRRSGKSNQMRPPK